MRGIFSPLIGPFAVLLMASATHAASINVSDSQDIISQNQGFTFIFNDLSDSDGTGGAFFVNASGDINAGVEHVDFDLGVGIVRLDDTGVVSSSISGLSLVSFNSQEILCCFDVSFQATFSVSAALLDVMLADNQITVNVQNSFGVEPHNFLGKEGTDPDFIEVGFSYSTVPIPASFWLLGSALGLLVRMRRKRCISFQ